jgi:hypothetical protein
MSIITSSNIVGTDAPDAPPLVALQFVELFQNPVPPVTKYLAIL